MKRPVTAAVRRSIVAALLLAPEAAVLLAPEAALAQSYQTALPLSPQEKVALEARLSTILDYARPGDLTDIALPTGRVATVRTYQTVNPGGEGPCRGYRIDLVGPGGQTAVDGFRCRHPSGPWVIAEPETVLSARAAPMRRQDDVVVVQQQGGPLDLRGGLFGGNEVTVVVPDGTSPDPLPRRLPDEPLYPGDEPETLGNAAPLPPPPVPRPSPRREAAVATAEPETAPVEPAGAETAPADVTETPVATAPEPDATPPAETASAATAPADAGAAATPPAETVAEVEPDAGAGTSVIVPTTGIARQVGARTTSSAPDYASDPRVTTALEDLAYLDPATQPTPDAVAVAVDEFARDERFALPISADALAARLDAARDRSRTIAVCGPGVATVCVSR